MLFSTPKLTAFLASVVAASAQSGVFFGSSNCAGTQLQTVEYTDGQCVPSNGAVSVLLQNQNPLDPLVTFYTDLAHQDPSFQVILIPGESECVNIPGNIQSVGMFW
ncbi:hypothetical protein C8J57DRAFT_1521675 [Mycena rebaudengoi]|nr:hypothetical protein C8J57DRAFT_1521675 [Mycena rebaudengoi]